MLLLNKKLSPLALRTLTEELLHPVFTTHIQHTPHLLFWYSDWHPEANFQLLNHGERYSDSDKNTQLWQSAWTSAELPSLPFFHGPPGGLWWTRESQYLPKMMSKTPVPRWFRRQGKHPSDNSLKVNRGAGEIAVVKSYGCSCRGSGSVPSTAMVAIALWLQFQETWWLLSDLHGYWVCMWYTHIQAHTHNQ